VIKISSQLKPFNRRCKYLLQEGWIILDNTYSSEELRKVAMAFDSALEGKDLNAVLESFSVNCEIEFLNIKLSGKEGAKKWFNWIFEHVTKIKFLPIIIMVEGNTFFEEFKVTATFHDGEEVHSKQAVVLVFENLKIQSLRMYFDRLDFSDSVAKDIISKTIIRELVKKSLEGLR
jgi:ketosteroid isomerase-like protein